MRTTALNKCVTYYQDKVSESEDRGAQRLAQTYVGLKLFEYFKMTSNVQPISSPYSSDYSKMNYRSKKWLDNELIKYSTKSVERPDKKIS